MTRWLAPLRALAVAAVMAAIVDPGCARSRTPVVALDFTGDVPPTTRDRVAAAVARGTGEWADLRVGPLRAGGGTATTAAVGADLRILAGDAAPVLEALRTRPAAVVVRPATPALTIIAAGAPATVVAGTRATVLVTVADVPTAPGRLTVTIVDRDSGQEQGRATLDLSDRASGDALVPVPWLAVREGRQVLRATATYAGGTPVRPAPPADVSVEVVPAGIVVEVLEARPTWGARFARLALASGAAIDLRTEVRVAPGVVVHTGSDAAAGKGADSAVILVGGVEALSDADVSRLERAVRERGRAVVLLVDDAPRAGPWRRLWPDPTGPVRSSAQPVTAHVGGHVWRTREWITPMLSTRVQPLAYLDTGRQPVIVGRAVGPGRVVLVAALDAWRWRAGEDVGWAQGWQSLVQRLAADVPPPVHLLAWASGHGSDRTVHAEVVLRPDTMTREPPVVTAELSGGGGVQRLPLWPAGRGRWRGAARPFARSPQRVRVEAHSGHRVVGRAEAVVDVSRIAPAAGWDDVDRHQLEAGAVVVGEAQVAEAVRARAATTSGQGERRYVTRTRGFAGLVLAVLGTEWILRRAARRR